MVKPDDIMSAPTGAVTDRALAEWASWNHLGVAWRLAPSMAGNLCDWLSGCPIEDWSHAPDAEVLKRDRYHTVTARNHLVFKRVTHKAGGWWHLLRFAVRPSQVRRACRMALALRAHGMRVAEPVAFGREKRRGVVVAETIVTRRIAGVAEMTVLLADGDEALRRRLLRSYGALLGDFHRHGFSNRDLKDGNVLCQTFDPSALWVADMDGIRRHRRLTRFRCARDWRVLARSLALCGYGDPESMRIVLDGYNATVPERLRWRCLPWFTEKARRDGIRKLAARGTDKS